MEKNAPAPTCNMRGTLGAQVDDVIGTRNMGVHVSETALKSGAQAREPNGNWLVPPSKMTRSLSARAGELQGKSSTSTGKTKKNSPVATGKMMMTRNSDAQSNETAGKLPASTGKPR